MQLELPLEQLVRRRGRACQLSFATEAMDRVPRRVEYALAPSALGLHLLARDEDALEAPLGALRRNYGRMLDVAPPRVRFIEGVATEAPIMHVEISVERRHQTKVREAMARRGARPCADFERLFSVMRYEAPLADLLGLRDELARLTRGVARHWMALSHYAHVKDRKEAK